MSERQVGIVNPANAVTLIRALAIFPLWYFIDQGWRDYAFILLVIAGFMDQLDGLVARVFDCRSAFGELFDSVADGFLYGGLMVVLIAYGWAPREWAIAMLALGAWNFVNRLIYARRVGRAVNFRSVAMERFTGTLAMLIGFAVVGFEPEFYYTVCGIIMVVIVVHDAKRMLLDPVPA